MGFLCLGSQVEVETHSGDGRLDAVARLPDHIYVFEFKLDRSGKAALKQLKEKDYAERFCHIGLPLTGIGVNFSSKTRKINGWLIESL